MEMYKFYIHWPCTNDGFLELSIKDDEWIDVTLGKNWITEEQCVFMDMVLLPLLVYTVFHVLSIKQTEAARSEILFGYRHYQYKHTFLGQDHINEFQSSTNMISQGQSHTQNYLV